jgi:hypothetical protein
MRMSAILGKNLEESPISVMRFAHTTYIQRGMQSAGANSLGCWGISAPCLCDYSPVSLCALLQIGAVENRAHCQTFLI